MNVANRMSMTLLLLGLIVPACAALDIKTEHDPTAEFSRYRTFAFADPAEIGEERTPEEIKLRDHIEPAVSRGLGDKGLQVAGQDEPADLAVYYWVNVKAKQRKAWGRGYAWGARYGGAATSYPYREGTLVLDLVEPTKKELVWRATVTAPLAESTNDNMDLATKAITQALAQYPPKTQTVP